MKSILIKLVHLYQKYMPKRIRRACLYTPSCSEYMILAIEKYGSIVGVFKGVKRIFRCKHPNGGIDYP